MALSKSTITGRVPLPTDENLQFAELTFALSGLDTEGASVLPGGVSTRAVLIGSDIPAGFELWQNTAGLRGTNYQVLARWTVKDRDGIRDQYADLGIIQVGASASYTLADLINSGVPQAVGTFWTVLSQAEYDAAIQAATDAQAWAESDAAPGDPGTKSAKTWAGEAEAIVTDLGTLAAAVDATAADVVLTSLAVDATAADRVQTGIDVITAQSARDASFANATVYTSVAAGRAAVADGAQFTVVLSGATEAIRYQRIDASSQTELARYPTSAAVAIRPASGGVVIPGSAVVPVEISIDGAGRAISYLTAAGDSFVLVGTAYVRSVNTLDITQTKAELTALQPDHYATDGVYIPGVSGYSISEITLWADGRINAFREPTGASWSYIEGVIVQDIQRSDVAVLAAPNGVVIPGMSVAVAGVTTFADGRVAEVLGQDGKPYYYGSLGWWAIRENEHDFDIVVYGTSLAGIMATVRASLRRGKRVCIIEPLARLGGMHAAGLVEVDASSASGKETSIMGGDTNNIYFRALLDKDGGGTSIAITAGVKYTPQPKTCEAVANELCAAYAAKILRNCPLEPADVVTEVINGQKRIKGVLTREGLITARVFIDASYEGDLMAGALTAAYWTTGREAAAEFSEPYAGYLLDNRTLSFGVGSGFTHYGGALTGGARDDILAVGYPITKHADPGLANGAADPTVQAYNFRLVMTRDAANRVSLPKPEGYSQSLITTTLQLLKTNGAGYSQFARPTYGVPSLGYQGVIQGGKVGFNSLDLVNGQHEYTLANWTKRRAIVEEHVIYQQSMLWGLANDPITADFGLSALQTDMVAPTDSAGAIGLCADEWAYSEWGQGWPYWLYVREARRLKGAYIMSVWDMTDESTTRPVGHTSRLLSKSTSIGKWAYTLDIHQIRGYQIINGGTGLPYTDRLVVEGTPPHAGAAQPIYQIPVEALYPIKAACSNILVPWCSSHTHVAWAQARLEIPSGFCGEAAGEIAAWVVDNPTQGVQDMPYATLSPRLVEYGSKL